jgi:hypothetical protein
MAREGMAALIKQNANGKVINRETGQSSLANKQMIAGLKKTEVVRPAGLEPATRPL